MAGTIYLGCGDAADEEPLWRAMLHRPLTRIVYWPFALPPELGAGADNWLRGGLDQLGAGYQLDTWQDLAGHDAAELNPDKVDLLFVGGGNTFQLLDHVQRHGFLDPVRAFSTAGGDYYGGSAGAVLACESIDIADGLDPNECGLTDLRSLNLLPHVAILPHFTDQQLTRARDWSRQHQIPIWGLPEPVGLRSSDDTVTIFGAGRLTMIGADGTACYAYPGDSFDVPLTDRPNGPSHCG